MNNYTFLGIILIGLFFLWAWRSDRRQKERQSRQMAETEERRTSEEYVVQRQMAFEKRLHDGVEIGLPDAVRGRSAHIYRYLMREWFSKLVAQSRYDKPKLGKLRKDWLIYMEMLETSRTSNFLSLESRDEAAREKHGRPHGFFGIVEDRDNEFAWRQGAAAAKRMAVDLASSSMRASPKPPTWIYTPKDFASIAQDCADTFDKIGTALKLLPIAHGLLDPISATTRDSGT